jgi:hypothetical protein
MARKRRPGPRGTALAASARRGEALDIGFGQRGIVDHRNPRILRAHQRGDASSASAGPCRQGDRASGPDAQPKPVETAAPRRADHCG